MATDDGRRFASAFDDMLESSRQQFDALLSGAGASPPVRPAATDLTPRLGAAASVDIALQLFNQSPAAVALTRRFGDGWRCEVVEHEREGDEVIALCKLHAPTQGIVRSQFGVARLSEVPGRDEAAALHAAVSDAMENCAHL